MDPAKSSRYASVSGNFKKTASVARRERDSCLPIADTYSATFCVCKLTGSYSVINLLQCRSLCGQGARKASRVPNYPKKCWCDGCPLRETRRHSARNRTRCRTYKGLDTLSDIGAS